MSSQEPGDFCLDCHWDAFDEISAKFPMLPSSDQWHCDDVHHAGDMACNVDKSCCNKDDCSLNCSSVCDGFVDCEISSTVCSDVNCGDANCDDADCDGSHCENTGAACFDKHCFGGESQNLDNGAADLFQDTNFQWDASMFLPTMADHQADVPVADSHMTDQSAPTHCDNNTNNVLSNHHHHHHYHGSGHAPATPGQEHVKDCHNLWSPTFTNQIDMCHENLNHVLGDSALYTTDSNNNVLFNQPFDTSKMPCFQDGGAPSCSDTGFQHLGCYLRNSGDTRLLGFSKSQAQNHVHRHYHGQAHHRVSHYSRHHNSRKSISSQTMSSLIDSPPSLDRAMSSALTSPAPGMAEEAASHVCRWNRCNTTFASAGELQQHLIAEHMKPINGAKGHGYYCCWEGCHRPDEPFSQKSKLQGHFLTHSNYKSFSCSVCGKAFARQATLERHERSHRGEKPFKCKECGKAFTDSSELKTHSRTHTGEKPFKCTFPGCDFQTGDSSNMSSHKLTHSGRRHKCTYPGCTKSFTRPDQLKRHLKTTHKLENTSFPANSTLRVPTPIGTTS